MHSLHPSYSFNVPEVSNEFNLLSNFLSSSIIDENTMYGADPLNSNQMGQPPHVWSPGLGATMAGPGSSNAAMSAALIQEQEQQLQQHQILQQADQIQAVQLQHGPQEHLQQWQMQSDRLQPGSASMPRPAGLSPSPQPPSRNGLGENGNSSAMAETYYHFAADPSGTESADERMNKLLKAKYDAGLLKPFNYVGGYSRMYRYMEKHLHPESRAQILKQLDKFRPKFRERMQSLTDLELVLVEMWFDRTLMEYDRVFASMAVPACCWRRTGQIFRGNKEMAQLIGVPMESFRD
ncbi:hypothetical protein KEM52_005988, partial [Ascosphaera acerosa]